MNILVAVDTSPHSWLALQLATGLADRHHARLTVFTAIVRPCAMGLAEAGGMACVDDAERAAAEISRAACRRVPDDVSVTAVVSSEPVHTGLLRQVKTGGHDLVVMGSRQTGLRRAAGLDRVSRYVLRRSPVPVMIARAVGDRHDHITSGERRVTVAPQTGGGK
jgi:nucleotide-binding universal stress UspA family protein